MKIATSEEMQRLDKDAQTRYGISSLILMENAGMQTVRHIEEKYGGLKKRVWLLSLEREIMAAMVL